MQSFIIRAWAWIWETSDLSFASMRTTATLEVFSTFTLAFDIDAMCWLHMSPPALCIDPCMEPCVEPELPVDPIEPLEVPDDVEPIPELPVELVPVELPLDPVALDPLPLLPVPDPDCAWAPTASANATTATIFFMSPPLPRVSRHEDNVGTGARGGRTAGRALSASGRSSRATATVGRAAMLRACARSP